jgi:YD repeat-containing protein
MIIDTSSTDPSGVTTTYEYTSLGGRYPQLTSQWVGPDNSRKVDFGYCFAANCLGLPNITLSAPNAQGQRSGDSLFYDALGNLSKSVSAGGKCTEFVNDGIGRVTSTRTRVAGTCRPTAPPPPPCRPPQICPVVAVPLAGDADNWVLTETVYDALERESFTTTTAPASGAFPMQRVEVRTAYDGKSGLVTAVRRTASDNGSLGTLTDSMTYDRIGRVITHFAQGASPDFPEQIAYDAAGNVTRRDTPRGAIIFMTYDALDRLTRREVTYMVYNRRAPRSPNYTTPIPWRPLSTLGETVVAGDVATFEYDTGTGALQKAANANALTERTYFTDGALKTECQSQRNVNGTDASQHRMCVSYGYDVGSRRTRLITPTGDITYGYIAATGQLETITGPTGQSIGFGYDLRGQLTSILRPGPINETMQYTLDGELERNALTVVGFGPASLRDAALQYDVRGKMLSYRNRIGIRDTVATAFSPMGHVASSRHVGYGVNQTSGSVRTDGTETMVHDALGNMRSASLRVETVSGAESAGSTTPRAQEYYSNGSGRLRTTSVAGAVSAPYEYDNSGNSAYSSVSVNAERADFYNGLGQLVASDARNTPGDVSQSFAFNEYRYDALGRRVWTRTRRTCRNTTELYCDTGLVRRTVWDGSSELYEIQQLGNDDATDAEMESDGAAPNDPNGVRCRRTNDGNAATTPDSCTLYGQVLYVHGQTVDAPLAAIRYNYRERQQLANGTWVLVPFPAYTMYPHWSPLGVIENANVDATTNTFAISSLHPAGPTWQKRDRWPGGYTPYMQQNLLMPAWRGTLLESKREFAGGLIYRRNRYIDAQTGRFTQPDPIGLGGGLNS